MLARYRVERLATGQLGKPVELDDAVRIVSSRLQRLEDGDALTIRKVLYELPPEEPPNADTAEYTAPILRGYRSLVLRFPKVGWMGGFVCKFASGTSRTTSQHAVKVPTKPSAGNAIDWAAPDKVEQEGGAAVIAWLTKLADWIVAETKAGRRETSEVIWRDRKWTPERGWREYTGPFHAAHVHESAAPYIEAHAACLD